MIVIKQITAAGQFCELESVWNPLLEKSGSNNVFSTFEWLSTWWEHFGQDKKLFILLALDGEEVIGIAPLIIEKKRILRYAPLRVVSFIGTGISDYADFIIVKEREKVLNLFFEYLRKRKILWDEIDLKEIREDSPNLAVIQDNLEKQEFIGNICELGKCPYIEINNDWNNYYSSLSKNCKRGIIKKYNRIERNGLKCQFSLKYKNIGDTFLDALICMHLDGMLKKNKNSFLASAKGRQFLKTIIKKVENQNWIVIDVMHINDRVAAYALGFQYGEKYYHWNIGNNEKCHVYSPGNVLFHHMLKSAFLNNSINEIDTLRGEEYWKFRWTKLYRNNYQVNILGRSLYSKSIFKISEIYGYARRLIKKQNDNKKPSLKMK